MTALAQRHVGANLEQLSDAEVVNRICAGEPALYELIMRRHNRRLFRLARGILGNDADAEEAVQEAYVGAFFKLKQFRGPHGFGAWLYRIATNEALMRRRKQKRLQLIFASAPEVHEEAQNQKPELDQEPAAADPESDLYRLQLQHLLEKAVDDLPSAYRAAFVMREIEHLSTTETAEALGIEEATVKTRVHRARRLLQGQLSSELQTALEGIYQFDGDRCDRIIAVVFSRLDATEA